MAFAGYTAAASLIASLCLATGHATAQTNAVPLTSGKPVSLIVGYAPGGAADGVTRIFAKALQETLGNVIVENRPGASSQIAVDYVKRSNPDGHTILIAPGSLFSVNPLVYETLPYDADKDLTPLATLTINPAAMSVGAAGPYKTLDDFIAAARKDPRQANIGVATMGSPLYLGVLALSDRIGAGVEPVLYRGANQALTDLIGGQIGSVADALASQLQFHQSGKIRIVGVSGNARAVSAPDIPTLKEQGYPEFEYTTNWYAAFVPANTPANVRAALEKALIETTRRPDVRASLMQFGVESAGLGAADTLDRIRTERTYWKPVIEKTGFKIQP